MTALETFEEAQKKWREVKSASNGADYFNTAFIAAGLGLITAAEREVAMNEIMMETSRVMEALCKHVEEFIQKQNITCAETIYQTDRVIENAYKFIEGCCDIVGYHEYEGED